MCAGVAADPGRSPAWNAIGTSTPLPPPSSIAAAARRASGCPRTVADAHPRAKSRARAHADRNSRRLARSAGAQVTPLRVHVPTIGERNVTPQGGRGAQLSETTTTGTEAPTADPETSERGGVRSDYPPTSPPWTGASLPARRETRRQMDCSRLRHTCDDGRVPYGSAIAAGGELRRHDDY